MKPEHEFTEGEIKRTTNQRACPSCKTTLSIENNKCPFCGANLTVRICNYCSNDIPADEDPCHFCGHLEPANLPEKVNSLGTSSNIAGIGFLIIIFALGLAMIIWPTANIPDISSCDPDSQISCFIETYWGVPGGIYLIGLSLLCPGLSALTSFIRKKRR